MLRLGVRMGEDSQLSTSLCVAEGDARTWRDADDGRVWRDELDAEERTGVESGGGMSSFSCRRRDEGRPGVVVRGAPEADVEDARDERREEADPPSRSGSTSNMAFAEGALRFGAAAALVDEEGAEDVDDDAEVMDEEALEESSEEPEEEEARR